MSIVKSHESHYVAVLDRYANEPYMFLSAFPDTTIAYALKLYNTNKLIFTNMTVMYFFSAVCKEVVCVIDEPDHAGKLQCWELVSFLLKT